jgi:hypothetical protein
MSEDDNRAPVVSLRREKAANDNAPMSYKPSLETTVTKGAAGPMRIHTDLPEVLPIIDGEIALIEAFMSDLIGAIIANDNHEP